MRLNATTGVAFGPFVVEEVKARAGSALRLRSPSCEGPIWLRIAALADPPPDELVARLFPPAEWRTLYVYRGRTSQSLDRVSALLRYRALGLLAGLGLTANDPSEAVFFVLHWQKECEVPPEAALQASGKALAVANTVPAADAK